MYKVIIIEDDPMVASINKQYVELTSSFHVEAGTGGDRPPLLRPGCLLPERSADKGLK